MGADGQRAGVGSVALAVLAGIVLFVLIAPIVIIVMASFGSGRQQYLAFPPSSLSLHLYERFLLDPKWLQALSTSVQVAGLTMIFATGLGLVTALGLVRGRFRWKGLAYALLLSPMIVPTIITAIALYFFFVRLHATGNVLVIALGHTVLALPVAVILISATLQGFDERLEHAALSLGAGRLLVLRRITLPLIGPGIFAAALFAFLTSFDELLIPLFLSSQRVQTLTVRMWGVLLYDADPVIAALSAVLIGLTMAILGTFAVLRWRNEAQGV